MRGAGAPKTLYHQLFTALKGRPLGEAAETDRTGNLPKLPAPQPRLQNVLTARLPAPPHAMGCPRALPTHLSPLPRSLGSEQTGGAKPRLAALPRGGCCSPPASAQAPSRPPAGQLLGPPNQAANHQEGRAHSGACTRLPLFWNLSEAADTLSSR